MAPALSAAVIVLFVAAGVGCGGTSSVDDSEILPECRSYLSTLEHCAKGLDPSLASQRTATAHQTFTAAAKDPVAREKLAERCRAASEQISRACR